MGFSCDQQICEDVFLEGGSVVKADIINDIPLKYALSVI